MSLAAATTNKEKVILDSLPYIETVHADYEEYALAMIEEEMQSSKPRALPRIPPMRFRTSLLQEEYDGLELVEDESDCQRIVSNFRRQQGGGNSFQPLKIVRPTNLEEWKTHALPQMKSRFEAERIRGVVLEAEKEEGVKIWKDYNANVDGVKEFWSQALKQSTEKVEEINFQRQEAQGQKFGPELGRLDQEYQQALYRRNQLEHSIEALRREAVSSADTSRKRKA
ncbi:MAG: hypothetical protein SGILL_004163 [Bacillariaceae sp.]